jgi:hypothetical protein
MNKDFLLDFLADSHIWLNRLVQTAVAVKGMEYLFGGYCDCVKFGAGLAKEGWTVMKRWAVLATN